MLRLSAGHDLRPYSAPPLKKHLNISKNEAYENLSKLVASRLAYEIHLRDVASD